MYNNNTIPSRLFFIPPKMPDGGTPVGCVTAPEKKNRNATPAHVCRLSFVPKSKCVHDETIKEIITIRPTS